MLHVERAMSRQMMALQPTRYSHKPSLTLSWHAVSLRLCYQILVKRLIPSLIVTVVTLRRWACRDRPRFAFFRDRPGGVLQCRIVSNNMGRCVNLFEHWLPCYELFNVDKNYLWQKCRRMRIT